MSDSKLDFSKARPGDVLWSDRYGKVEVVCIYGNHIDCRVRHTGGCQSWLLSGHYNSIDATNDLHWSRPVFEEPPPPKWMKKVRIEREAHFVRTMGRDGFTVHLSYTSTNWCPVDCIHHQPVVFDFEVPE